MESQPQIQSSQTSPIPPPPPTGLFDLTPPPFNDGTYRLFHMKKHLAMINGEEDFGSSTKEVASRYKKQYQACEKLAKESESSGFVQTRNLSICSKCPKCNHWVQTNELSTHLSFHAAVILQNKLLLGDKHCSQSKKQLIERHGVTHIVNAAIELSNFLEEEGIKYCNLNLYDTLGEDVIPESIRAAEFIKQSIDQGGVVFVHCAMGKSRSVSAIIMYLMNYCNMSYEESIEHIKKTRPIAKPNSTYIKQLIEYHRKKSKET